jgi:hypothetical protein
MKTYTIKITIHEKYVMDVDAETEDEAKDKAVDLTDKTPPVDTYIDEIRILKVMDRA